MATAFPVATWAKRTNIYEVNIRQYTTEGTFNAFSKHLPRLKKMGVDILWLMPVTPISVEKRQGTMGSYYATSCYTTLNPEFGTPTDFKTLVETAHAFGMKIMIDWVANHTGCDHKWITEHPDWYKKNEDGSFAILHGWRDVYHLDYTKKEVQHRMRDAMKFWVTEYDVDGFRCDMAHLVPLEFWKEVRKACDELKPLYWLGECEEPEYSLVFDTTYAWEWMHASKAKVRNETSITALKELLTKYLLMPSGGYKLMFTSNHDENSWNGTEYERYGDAAKMLAVFSCLFKGVPLVYSGQEKPNLRRLAFFEKDEIDWNGDLALYDFYYRLLTHRRSHTSFETESYRFILTSEEEKTIAFMVGDAVNNTVGVFNFSNEEVSVNVSDAFIQGNYCHLFNEVETQLSNNYFSRLPPFSFNVIYTKDHLTD